MKELSLNILDIAQNSVKAKATLIEIFITQTKNTLTLTVKDNGCGMSEEMVRSVTNPFCTSRKTRSVGLGIPFLKLAAELTGGNISISSRLKSQNVSDSGTTVNALFYTDHIDFTPLGDIISTIKTLIQCNPDTDWVFVHKFDGSTVSLDTRELRGVLEDVPLNNSEVIEWIGKYLKEQYDGNRL